MPGFVADQINEGADYLKAHLEDGRLFGDPLPAVEPSLVAAACTGNCGYWSGPG